MAYNPNPYSPYGLQTQMFQPQPQFQQPINGLQFIKDASVLETLRMPPGSTSQPYFLEDENKFIVVTFDNVGGSTKETFSFTKDPVETNDNSSEFVTREYFDQQINNIMEAINGKHAVQPEQPE